jgi:hypothetical protein
MNPFNRPATAAALLRAKTPIKHRDKIITAKERTNNKVLKKLESSMKTVTFSSQHGDTSNSTSMGNLRDDKSETSDQSVVISGRDIPTNTSTLHLNTSTYRLPQFTLCYLFLLFAIFT